MKTPFQYAVIRYMPDAVTGEFANVGVVVLAPQAKFLRARCTKRYGRTSQFFGSVDGQHFRRVLEMIEMGVRQIERELGTFLLDLPEDVVDVLRRIIPIDDSTLLFGETKGGLTSDPRKTLEDLFDRFVGRFEDDLQARRRPDADVWRSFRRELDKAGVSEILQPHRVEAPLFSYDFEHALKNGTWHALEAVSFDLADPDSIRDKATRWLGRATTLVEAEETIHLHYLVGKPADPGQEIARAFSQARRILDRSPLPHDVVDEDESEAFAQQVRTLVESHEGNGTSR